jgi:hypothetical protein
MQPEIKQQFFQWKKSKYTETESGATGAIKRNVHQEFVLAGQTVNSAY